MKAEKKVSLFSRTRRLNAKKFRNLTLSDAQLRNRALAVPHFSCKTSLLHPQEGHLLRQIAITAAAFGIADYAAHRYLTAINTNAMELKYVVELE